jgi:hypothetical protein
MNTVQHNTDNNDSTTAINLQRDKDVTVAQYIDFLN